MQAGKGQRSKLLHKDNNVSRYNKIYVSIIFHNTIITLPASLLYCPHGSYAYGRGRRRRRRRRRRRKRKRKRGRRKMRKRSEKEVEQEEECE